MNQWLTDHIPETIATLLTATAAWFGKHILHFGPRISKLDKRVTKLEVITVTRDDFDELRESLNATFTNAAERIERRTDQIWQHLASRDGSAR